MTKIVRYNKSFFGVLLFNLIKEHNIGACFRSAHVLGASFLITIGNEYKRDPGDVTGAKNILPYFNFKTIDSFMESKSRNIKLIGIEKTNFGPKPKKLELFSHPSRAIYCFGNEQVGLSEQFLRRCDSVIEITSIGSLNVAVSCGIVLYDRFLKMFHQYKNI